MQCCRGFQAGTQDGDLSVFDPDGIYAQDSNGLIFRELHTNCILAQFKDSFGTCGGASIVVIEDGKLVFVY
jgi:hypothetical protein